MRLGLNILYLIPGGVGGTETYARELIREMTQQLKSSDELVIYASRETAPTFNSSKQVRIVTVPIYAKNRFMRLLAEQLLLPLYLLRDRISVVFSLGYSSPIIHPCPAVVTIHDLNWYYHPEDFSAGNRIVWNILTRLSAATSNHVITDSNYSLTSLKKILKIKNVTAILHGTPSPITPVKPKFTLPKKYLFTVSASYPHKNLNTLIKVFNELSKHDPKLYLVICGLSGSGSESLKNEIKNSPSRERILILGYITRAELSYVYSHASVFVFPSAYEGFGYPVIEAMSYGLPVVSSSATSLSEVVGYGGVLVDPFDIEQYVRVVTKIVNNDEYRAQLIIRGRKRCEELNWASTVMRTLSIIRSL